MWRALAAIEVILEDPLEGDSSIVRISAECTSTVLPQYRVIGVMRWQQRRCSEMKRCVVGVK